MFHTPLQQELIVRILMNLFKYDPLLSQLIDMSVVAKEILNDLFGYIAESV